MALREKIQTALIGSKFMGEEETCKILTEITGKKAKMYYTGIDDGVDDDESEDSYVMKASFDVEDMGQVRIFYGDVTKEIGFVAVTFNE